MMTSAFVSSTCISGFHYESCNGYFPGTVPNIITSFVDLPCCMCKYGNKVVWSYACIEVPVSVSGKFWVGAIGGCVPILTCHLR